MSRFSASEAHERRKLRIDESQRSNLRDELSAHSEPTGADPEVDPALVQETRRHLSRRLGRRVSNHPLH